MISYTQSYRQYDRPEAAAASQGNRYGGSSCRTSGNGRTSTESKAQAGFRADGPIRQKLTKTFNGKNQIIGCFKIREIFKKRSTGAVLKGMYTIQKKIHRKFKTCISKL
jgi:hypothetical protein